MLKPSLSVLPLLLPLLWFLLLLLLRVHSSLSRPLLLPLPWFLPQLLLFPLRLCLRPIGV